MTYKPYVHKPPIKVGRNKSDETALEISRYRGFVSYIPLQEKGIKVQQLAIKEFDKIYSPIPDYPTKQAAKLLVGVATHIGGTSKAMSELGKIVHVTNQEKEMAASAATTKTKSKGKVKAKTKAKGKTKAKVKATKTERQPRESAAALFKDLIMNPKGKTDDQIFNEVKKKFNLSDDKRKYVAWYRNSLNKAGQNPPAAKSEAKKDKVTAKKK